MMRVLAALGCLYFAQPYRINYSKGLSFLQRDFVFGPIYVSKMAKIHESYFKGWVDLGKLDPSRVKIVDSYVELKGPVWIVPETDDLLRNRLMVTFVSAALGAVISYNSSKAILSPPSKKKKDHPTSLAIGMVAGAALGAATWMHLSKAIPKTVGIFFSKLPSN
jgi:hypothetical protein